MMLKTPQTGPEGQEVRKVYVEEGCRIARELYLGMTLDREIGRLDRHGLDRGRRGHRGGGGASTPEKILQASGSTRSPASCRSRRGGSPSGSGSPATR